MGGQEAVHCVNCASGTWVPRGDCGPWELWQIAMYATSHVVIFGAYLLLGGLMLVQAVNRRRNGQAWMLSLTFSLFITACGIGHLEGLLSFWWPNYPLFAWWHLVTAAISILAGWHALTSTAALMVRRAPGD